MSCSKRTGKRSSQNAARKGTLQSSWYYSSTPSSNNTRYNVFVFKGKKLLVLREWQKSERMEFSPLPFLLRNTVISREGKEAAIPHRSSEMNNLYHKRSSVTKITEYYPCVFPEQNILHWFFCFSFSSPIFLLHTPKDQESGSGKSSKSEYLLFVFVYVAKRRELDSKCATDPSAKQQRVVYLVTRVAAGKGCYKDPHFQFCSFYFTKDELKVISQLFRKQYTGDGQVIHF